jgi:hypothetical protein
MHGTIDWTAILAGMFQDPRFRSWGRWKWFAEIEGKGTSNNDDFFVRSIAGAAGR